MSFWLDFGEAMQGVWDGLQLPITIGGFTFTLANVLIFGGLLTCVARIVWSIIDNDIQ